MFFQMPARKYDTCGRGLAGLSNIELESQSVPCSNDTNGMPEKGQTNKKFVDPRLRI